MIFNRLKQFDKLGIMGLNRRNVDYTLKHNKRYLYPLVDDKLTTKMLAIRAGIAVPELYKVIKIIHQIHDIHSFLKQYSSFVVKPAHGSSGNGVLLISGHAKNGYRKLNGLIMNKEELENHISEILSGVYSLGGHTDHALIEYEAKLDPLFEKISYQGMPDIRIIVFLGVPVMSMVRLPTRMSNGKANLHQGAIGVGINLATGTTLSGVWLNEIITEHPDTGVNINGIAIPNWQNLLILAARCYELTGLGYQGVDIILDKGKGPLILELNARPGLNIQIANRVGLLGRLKLIEDNYHDLKKVADRVSFAQNYFN